MANLARLADAWLAGWDAGRADKPESSCPFGAIASVEANPYATMWVRGWHAAVRDQPADRRAKARFLAVSIGIEASPLTPGDEPWAFAKGALDRPAEGWVKNLNMSGSDFVCWENGEARIYRYRKDYLYAAADGGGWYDGLFQTFEEALSRIGDEP